MLPKVGDMRAVRSGGAQVDKAKLVRAECQ